jgi:hypothetical protein
MTCCDDISAVSAACVAPDASAVSEEIASVASEPEPPSVPLPATRYNKHGIRILDRQRRRGEPIVPDYTYNEAISEERKRLIRKRTYWATKSGELPPKRARCQLCDEIERPIERHHHTYKTHTHVFDLCDVCHAKIHADAMERWDTRFLRRALRYIRKHAPGWPSSGW